MAEHPMQPLEFDDSWQRSVRFKENKIVSFLLESGPFNLNQISSMPFSNEDYTHFMQLIGYSVSGYGELSTTPQHLAQKADRLAAELLVAKNKKSP